MNEQAAHENDVEEETDSSPRRIRWYTHAGDYMNTLKAFIGINYQGVPFAFAQSGLAFGIVGVFVIATLTDHCCQLLVSCKMLIIRRMCSERADKMSAKELAVFQEHLEATLGYGDVGRLSFGPWCFRLIQFMVWFTQFIYLIIYFVFIGNTVQMIFPPRHHPILPNCTLLLDVQNIKDTLFSADTRLLGTRHGPPHVFSPNVALASQQLEYCEDHPSSVFINSSVSTDLISFVASNMTSSTGASNDLNMTSSTGASNDSNMTSSTGASNDSSTTSMISPSEAPTTEPTTAPDLRLIILFPIPFFIATSMVRRVRLLAPFSVISTVALVGGAISVAGYLIAGFKLAADYVLMSKSFKTVPIFLTQIISSYEGIGCILPIHSSMVGSRQRFPYYVHASIYVIFVILCTFGTLGYLRYGSNVQQIIALELPQHSVLSIIVDLTLIASVLFTYPLMCFPVIEITERFLFTSSGKFWRCCKRDGTQHQDGDSVVDQTTGLLPDTRCNDDVMYGTIEHLQQAVEVPLDIAAWKRNLTRILLTLSVAGLAVVLRDNFAYLGSFAGSVGASLLALILPCSIDIHLRYREMSRICFIKDISIIVFAVTCSALGLYSIGDKIATSGKP